MKRIIIQRHGRHQRVIDVDTMQEVQGTYKLVPKMEPGEVLTAKLTFEVEVVDVQVMDAPQMNLPFEAPEEPEVKPDATTRSVIRHQPNRALAIRRSAGGAS